jgi:hypothetical protein
MGIGMIFWCERACGALATFAPRAPKQVKSPGLGQKPQRASAT